MSKDTDLQFCKHAVQMELLSRESAKERLRVVRKIVESGKPRPPIEVVLIRGGDLTLSQIQRVHARMVFEGEAPDRAALKLVAARRQKEADPGGEGDSEEAFIEKNSRRQESARSAQESESPSPSLRPDAASKGERSPKTRRAPEASKAPKAPKARKAAPKTAEPGAPASEVEAPGSPDAPGKSPRRAGVRGAAAGGATEGSSRYVIRRSQRPAQVGLLILLSAILVITLGVGYFLVFHEPGSPGGSSPSASFTALEVDRAGREFAAAVTLGDSKKIQALTDLEGLVDRILPARAVAKERAEFLKGMSERGTGVFDPFIASSRPPGSYMFLRVESREGIPHALCRQVKVDGDLNYHYLRFRRNSGGPLRLEDIYYTFPGEYHSEASRREILPILLKARPTIVEGPESGQASRLAQAETLTQLQIAVRMGQVETAFQAYDALSPSLKTRRPLLIRALAVAALSGSERYDRLRETHVDLHTDDPALYLLEIWNQRASGEFRLALEGVNRLDALIGGDPFLEFLRALLHFDLQDYPSALKRVERLGAYPELVLYRLQLELHIEVARGNHEKTVEILEQLEKGHGLDLRAMVDQDPHYEGFRVTDAYRRWKGQA